MPYVYKISIGLSLETQSSLNLSTTKLSYGLPYPSEHIIFFIMCHLIIERPIYQIHISARLVSI